MGPGISGDGNGGINIPRRRDIAVWASILVAGGALLGWSGDNLADMFAGPERIRQETQHEVELREIRRDFDQHVQDASRRFEQMSNDTDAKFDRVLNKLDAIEAYLRSQGD